VSGRRATPPLYDCNSLHIDRATTIEYDPHHVLGTSILISVARNLIPVSAFYLVTLDRPEAQGLGRPIPKGMWTFFRGFFAL